MEAISVRRELPGGASGIHHNHRKAFGQQAEADLATALLESGDYDPALSLVAVRDRIPFGHILFPYNRIETGAGDLPAPALAPVAVLPGFRRQGIGSAYIRRGPAEGRCLGHRIVIIVGHPVYYSRFGFSSAWRMGLTAPFPVPDEALLAPELVPGALRGVSGTVRYPAPFDVLV